MQCACSSPCMQQHMHCACTWCMVRRMVRRMARHMARCVVQIGKSSTKTTAKWRSFAASVLLAPALAVVTPGILSFKAIVAAAAAAAQTAFFLAKAECAPARLQPRASSPQPRVVEAACHSVRQNGSPACPGCSPAC